MFKIDPALAGVPFQHEDGSVWRMPGDAGAPDFIDQMIIAVGIWSSGSWEHRRFYADAAMRTFAVRKLNHAELVVLKEIFEGGGQVALAAIATILFEQSRHPDTSSHISPEDRKLLSSTAECLQQVSAWATVD